MTNANDQTPSKLDLHKLRLGTQFCFALYSTQLGLNKLYRKLLQDLDLTYPQYLVMLVLWERDQLIVSEICDELFLETTTLTPLLKRLEKQGYIQRQRSAEDERKVVVSLTEEGRSLRDKALNIPDCIADAVGYPIDRISDLRDELNDIRARLHKAI